MRSKLFLAIYLSIAVSQMIACETFIDCSSDESFEVIVLHTCEATSLYLLEAIPDGVSLPIVLMSEETLDSNIHWRREGSDKLVIFFPSKINTCRLRLLSPSRLGEATAIQAYSDDRPVEINWEVAL